MATIRTAIALYDGVTSPLASMNRALGIVLNSFEAMQTASGRAIDVAAISRAREELARTETALDGIENSIRQSENQQNRLNQSMRSGSSAAEGFLSKVKQVALTLGGVIGLQKVVGLSDQLASTTARLNLIVDDGGSLEQLQRQVMASAQNSRADYFETARAIAKMGANAGAAFDSNDEVIAFMEQVNKQFVIGGATAEEQKYAMIQLTQAMGAGALRGEELNSILEQAPGIARAIEQYMGIAEGSIKQVAQKGLVTSEIVKDALFSVADETNEKFNTMPKTWSQIWTGMKNSALSTFSPILRRINEIANTSDFEMMTNGILDALAGIAGVLSVVFELGVRE
nr:tape measure protein [uncultured Butyricicoccus sp.]